MLDATILRLVISQVFAVYLLLILIPLKKPQRKSTLYVIIGAFLITVINALVIIYVGIDFYIRFYFLTLLLPYFILLSYFAIYKNGKFIFALLSIQVIGNVAILNGLYASYILYGENMPLVDTIARILTYIIFLPVVIKIIRPTYLKMAKMLDKGWWILNLTLISSYALAYYILFVPDDIFKRPEYFTHAYIGILLSLLIYAIIYYLFVEVQLKVNIAQDKQTLSVQVSSLKAQSEEITSIAYKDALTGLNNRYSLYRKLDQLIDKQENFLVVFIDLDNLKEINDSYNHIKGDAYLKHFSIALEKVIKNQGEVFRFAGDEFIYLMLHDIDQFNADIFKNNVEKEMNFDLDFLGLSLGVAYYPKDGLTLDDLISLADQEMYKEKKEKKIRR